MVYTAVEVESLPPEAVALVATLHDDIHPSQSMSRMSFLEASHMHDSLYPHAPQIDKMNNIGLLASTPYFSCSYILHTSSHRIDICDTMVRCRNLVGSAPQIAYNFKSHGKYL